MLLLPIVTSSTIIPLTDFWHALLLYHDKPHVINRKIAGVVQLYLCELVSDKIKHIFDIFTYSGILYEVRKLQKIERNYVTDEFLKSFIEPYDKHAKLNATSLDDFKRATKGVFVSVRILISRTKLCPNCIELVILDRNQNRATFYAIAEEAKLALAPSFVYHIECIKTGNVRICLEEIEDCEKNSAEWLCSTVFPKILKWAEDVQEFTNIESLSLVNVDAYYRTYHKLKETYYEQLLKIWTENTDPQKFIHEDLAIATYLMLTFQRYKDSKTPSFVDLGCGNGLLVYILSQEGYPGIGIDVRKRKIWNAYLEGVNLQEKTLIPSSSSLFPEADWIIGNHSDELSPWIPVIALRSSPKTKFFVLPCCAYDFDGQKYKRINTSKSQYSEYIDYIKEVSIRCGFKVDMDKLRIPSTKRTCIIGHERSYETQDFEAVSEQVTKFINTRASDCSSACKSTWINNFEPRSPTERVRNCTQLNKDLISRIIQKAVDQVLETKKYIEKYEGAKWNEGGSVSFSAFAKTVPKEDLVNLKRECGGLKTLLRNHRYIFDVAKESFSLRKPYLLSETNKYKDKPCWFELNHPDKCLYTAEICAYKHVM